MVVVAPGHSQIVLPLNESYLCASICAASFNRTGDAFASLSLRFSIFVKKERKGLIPVCSS